ncbi:MAG: hypothetical protein Q8L47_02770 [bacterium]|nr:hypothetical protein [bacterium]
MNRESTIDMAKGPDKPQKPEKSQAELRDALQHKLSSIYTRPDGTKESISLNLDTKLQGFLSFYKKTKVDLTPDFEDSISDIWDRNQKDIEKAVEQNGFDDVLIIPGDISLTELAERMKMEDGYYIGVNLDENGSFAGIISQNVDKPRIILFHHIDTLPEITKQTGIDIHLNITGTEAQKLYLTNPKNYLSTLEDAIILERKYYEDTKKHLSDWKNKSAQWLPGSEAGSRSVCSRWSAAYLKYYVNTYSSESRNVHLGVRPARYFQ